MAETRLYKSRLKLASHVGAGLLLAVLFPLMTWQSERPVTRYLIGGGGALLFAIGAVSIARELTRRELVLLLDERGISGPGLATMRFVPWHAIDRVSVSGRLRRAVQLTIDDERMSAEETAAMALEKPMRDRRGYLLAEIRVPDLTLGPKQLAALIAERIRQHERAA